MKIEAIALAGLKGFKVQLVFGDLRQYLVFWVCFMLFVMVAPLLVDMFMNAWKPRLISQFKGLIEEYGRIDPRICKAARCQRHRRQKGTETRPNYC